MDVLKRAVNDDPDNPSTWLDYGLALLDCRLSSEAVRALERACELNPHAVDVRYYLGDALAENGKPEEAVRYSWSLASKDPGLNNRLSVPGLSALMRIAECLGELGHWAEAVSTVLPAVWLAVKSLSHVAYIH